MNELTTLGLNNAAPKHTTRELGDLGEKLAADHIMRRGMRIVCSNFLIPIGRNRRGAAVTGEIDIVALDGETLCFIEVKTRTSDAFASPVTAVDLRKQRQIIRAARLYRRIFGVEKMSYRYDAVAVVAGERPKIEYFKNYWDESRFDRKNWDRYY